MEQAKGWALCVVCAALVCRILELLGNGRKLQKTMDLVLGAAFLLCMVVPVFQGSFEWPDFQAQATEETAKANAADSSDMTDNQLKQLTQNAMEQKITALLKNNGLPEAKVMVALYRAQDGGLAVKSVTVTASADHKTLEASVVSLIYRAAGVTPQFVWEHPNSQYDASDWEEDG